MLPRVVDRMLAVEVEATVGGMDLRVKLPAHPGATVIVGPNGAGKTTLLKCLLGVIPPRRGRIELCGEQLYCSEQRIDVPVGHRQLGYVPQHGALFPHMTVLGNVGFGVRGRKAARDDQAMALLSELGIAHLARRRGRSLSGGEAQRVALCRALAIAPRALLLDEPTAGLDADARPEIRRFLVDRLAKLAIPRVVVSHDLEDARALGGRVVVLESGRVTQVGTVADLQQRPATPFIERFAGTAQPMPRP